MGKLIRCISEDGTLTVMAADTTDIVNRAQEIHGTSAVISAALGRLLTAASLMGSALKGADDSVTLRINGNGPAGTVLAASDSHGNVRGYAVNAVVELPLNDKGKLDVSGAVGKDGFLTVIKDLGLKEPYVGQVPRAAAARQYAQQHNCPRDSAVQPASDCPQQEHRAHRRAEDRQRLLVLLIFWKKTAKD